MGERRVSRRSFLKAGALAGGAAALGPALLAACAPDDGDGGDGGAASPSPPRYVPFHGEHQTGITAQPVPTLGLMASFKALAPDREALRETFIDLTDEIEGLMSGRPRATTPTRPSIRGCSARSPRPTT